MNGNRGAKGSIKDRIISFLYRERYKKNKVKKEDFTIKNKSKKLNYLTNLKQFKEKDINVLNNNDKKKVDSILNKSIIEVEQKNLEDKKVVGEITSKRDNENKKESYTVVKKRPIGITGTNIKDKAKDQEKVKINKEIKKTKAEINILSEVNSFVKKSKENINQIENQVNGLKAEIKNKNQDFSLIIEKQNKLKEKINKLKNQYDTVKNKYDLCEFKILESIKLMDNIDDYKTLARLNELEMMVNVCKDEIDSIKKIEIIKNNSDKNEISISKVTDEQEKCIIKFIKSKDKISEIEGFEEKLRNEMKDQQRIIDEMYDKASFLEHNLKKTTEYIGKRKILSSLFKITAGILTINHSDRKIFGIALGATLVNRGLKDLNKSYEKREKLELSLKYEDLTEKLNSIDDLLLYTNNVLNNSLLEVNKLKSNFLNEYKEYSNIIPNYLDSLNLINNLENKIKENQYKIAKMSDKVNEEKEINNKKMKKVKELKKTIT